KGSTGKPASASPSGSTAQVRFLDDINVTQDASVVKKDALAPVKKSSGKQAVSTAEVNRYISSKSNVESATALHFKYSVLLNTDVEDLVGNALLEHVDEWYGTPYRLGGST